MDGYSESGVLIPRRFTGRSSGCELLNLCVWVKSHGGMGSLYRSRHELVFVFRNGPGPHLNNIQLGRFGRNRQNVWNYAGSNAFARKGSKRNLELHPTVSFRIGDKDSDREDDLLDTFCYGISILLGNCEGF